MALMYLFYPNLLQSLCITCTPFMYKASQRREKSIGVKSLIARSSTFMSRHVSTSHQLHVQPRIRDPCGNELRPPANSQHQLDSHVSEPSWKQILHPQSGHQMITASTNTEILIHERLELDKPSQAAPQILTSESVRDNKCLYLFYTMF